MSDKIVSDLDSPAAESPTTCGGCRWFDHAFGSTGYCHRYPPRPLTFGTEEEEWVWPTVETEDFCGEHRPR